MINYDEMDKVIERLNSSALEVEKLTKTQEQIKAAEEKLMESKAEIEALTSNFNEEAKETKLALERIKEDVKAGQIENLQKLDSINSDTYKNLQAIKEDINNRVCGAVEKLEKIEEEHIAINAKMDEVLGDYKKLHSSFEFIEISLKGHKEQLVQTKESLERKLKEAKEDVGYKMEAVKDAAMQGANTNKKLIIGFGLVILLLAFLGLFI